MFFPALPGGGAGGAAGAGGVLTSLAMGATAWGTAPTLTNRALLHHQYHVRFDYTRIMPQLERQMIEQNHLADFEDEQGDVDDEHVDDRNRNNTSSGSVGQSDAAVGDDEAYAEDGGGDDDEEMGAEGDDVDVEYDDDGEYVEEGDEVEAGDGDGAVVDDDDEGDDLYEPQVIHGSIEDIDPLSTDENVTEWQSTTDAPHSGRPLTVYTNAEGVLVVPTREGQFMRRRRPDGEGWLRVADLAPYEFVVVRAPIQL